MTTSSFVDRAERARALAREEARPLNCSGIKPLGHAVLVEPYEPELKTSALYIPPEVRGKMQSADQRVRVIEAGPEAWIDEKQPRARPGDKVMVVRYVGIMIQGTADGKQYRLVNDKDIFCAIEVEEKAND